MNASWRVRLALVFALVMLLFLLSGVAEATTGNTVQWSAVIAVSFTPAQIAQPDWQSQAQALQAALAARVAARGVSMSVQRQTRSDGGTDYVVSLAGSQDLAQFKQVMFDDINPLGGMLGGPINLTLKGDVNQGEEVPIVLESNVASGSSWDLHQVDGARLSKSGVFELAPKGMLLGAPMRQTIRLIGSTTGTATLVLLYRRPWVIQSTPTRNITLSASRLSMLEDLSDPTPVQSAPAESNQTVKPTSPTAPEALPTAWDWRDHNGVPPIRDQGNCGSCWAFASIGAFESELMIQGGFKPQNLSEQFLISCNKDGWSCNGGWWANEYGLAKNNPDAKFGKNQTDTGGVMESAFPYNPGAVCPLNALNHPFKLSDWAYIVPTNPMSIAPTAAIKDAVYNHGPVATALCVGSGFGNYRGGVFNTDEKGTCGSSKINHAVDIVGWNDSNNTWIVRNSWGTGWGENGYMEIVRGISNVGFAANYVDYPATPGCFSVSTGSNPSTGGTVSVDTPPNCSNGTQYSTGTTVTFTAVPKSGFTFSGWSGDVTSNANPVTVTISGATSIVANFTSTTQTVQESDLRVQYNGWRGVGDPSANGGAYRVSNVANDSAKFKFSGTLVKWITRKGPDQGKAQVLIDGVNKGTFDLYSANATPNVQLSFGRLASQAHTIVVKVLGTQNASSTDKNVVVDGFVVGTTITQDNAPGIQYNSWISGASTNASGGRFRYSSTRGATMSFTFSGIGVNWILDSCPSCGQAEIYIDGADMGKIDTYSGAGWRYKVLKPFASLASGTHTIMVQVLGTKNAASTGTRINVDGFQYFSQ